MHPALLARAATVRVGERSPAARGIACVTVTSARILAARVEPAPRRVIERDETLRREPCVVPVVPRILDVVAAAGDRSPAERRRLELTDVIAPAAEEHDQRGRLWLVRTRRAVGNRRQADVDMQRRAVEGLHAPAADDDLMAAWRRER